MKQVSIGDVATIISGQHIMSEDYGEDPSGIPYLTGPADFGDRVPTVTKWTKLPKAFAADTDILITVKGNGVGKSNLGINAAIGRQLMAIRPTTTLLDRQYLFAFVRSHESNIANLGRGATVPGIGIGALASLKIPLPPLPEQRRIAAILDHADALCVKRRAAIAKLDSLAKSIFLDIHKPTPEKQSNQSLPMSQLAVSIRTGPFGSQLLHSEFVESGVAVLGIDNVVHNRFTWGQPRFVTEAKFQELQRYQVFPGDFLITIMGTCGRSAIVPDNIPRAINTKHICCITVDRARCLPEYLHASFLFDDRIQDRLGLRERGAVMPGLNMQLIKDLTITLPDLADQVSFVCRWRMVSALREKLIAGDNAHSNLFTSIQSNSFRGTH